MTESQKLYKQLKNTNIEKGEVDGECLSELLDCIMSELKSRKTSEFIDKIYTACMQYAYFPEQNKRTMSEIRVRPDSMDICGTDAVLIIEMLSMKIENSDCENSSAYKLNKERLFSKYSIKPREAKSRLSRALEKINQNLRQQGALAHFGKNADISSEVVHRDRSGHNLANAAEKMQAAHKTENVSTMNIDDEAAAMLKKTEEKCNAMTASAEKQAQSIIEKARERVNAMEAELDSVSASVKRAMNALNEANTALHDIK